MNTQQVEDLVKLIDKECGLFIGDLGRDQLLVVQVAINRMLQLDDRSLSKMNAKFLKELVNGKASDTETTT